MRVMGLAALLVAALPALAGQPGAAPQSRPPLASSIQLAQSCVCHNPVGAVGETVCRRQRVVRCRANTQNQCSWDVTNDRC